MHRTLPLEYRQTPRTPLELKHEVEQIIPKIENDLIGSLAWYSSDAHYVPNSIKIISLEPIDQTRYKMNYSFRWNLFNGCLDIDAEELTNFSVNVTCQANAMTFDFIDDDRSTMSEEL